MSRRRLTWTIVVAVLASGGLVFAALTGLVDDATEVGIFLAGVAAVAGVGSLVITAIGNATNARHLAELAERQEHAAANRDPDAPRTMTPGHCLGPSVGWTPAD